MSPTASMIPTLSPLGRLTHSPTRSPLGVNETYSPTSSPLPDGETHSPTDSPTVATPAPTNAPTTGTPITVSEILVEPGYWVPVAVGVSTMSIGMYVYVFDGLSIFSSSHYY